MKLTLKNVFLSVGMLAFAFMLFTSKAEASTCVLATGAHNWNDTAAWTGCGVTNLPATGDSISIPGGGVVTVNVDTPVVNDITISNASAGGATGITIGGSFTLSAASISMAVPVAVGVSTVDVAGGTLALTGNLTIMGGAGASQASVVTVAGGNINVTGNISFTGGTSAAQSQLTSTGASHIAIGGNLTGDGTFTCGTTGTLTFNGSGAQAIPVYAYRNLAVSKSAGTATLATGVVGIAGTLTVTAGTLDLAASTPTVTGATSVTGTLSISGANTKTFNGPVTINALGTLSESVATALVFGDNLTIAATGTMTENGAATFSVVGDFVKNGTYTASSGVHTFSGTGKIISGTALVTIPSVSITGTIANMNNVGLTVPTLLTIATTKTLTNTTVVTAPVSLTGAGGFINSATGTVKLAGIFDVTTFDVSAAGNTVEYNAAGDQTPRAMTYSNLTLSNSGNKTVTTLTIAGDLNINNAAVALLSNGTSSTSNRLLLGGTLMRSGVWGSTNAVGGVYSDNTYFVTANTGKLTVTTGRKIVYAGDINPGTPTTTTTTTSNGTTTTTTTTPGLIITAVTPPAVTPTTATISGCDGRTSGFSTVTGQSCSGSTTTVTTTVPVMIPGCNNGTTGFSTATGVSCANNGASVTTSTTYNFGAVTLKNGSKGAAVVQLQKFLNKFLKLGLAEDGKLGPKTIAVIKQWQKDHGLVADGLVGAKTKAMMNAEAENN